MTEHKQKLDWRIAVTVVVSTLLLVFDEYRMLFDNELLTRTLLYLIIPLALILLVYRESPAFFVGEHEIDSAGSIPSTAGRS